MTGDRAPKVAGGGESEEGPPWLGLVPYSEGESDRFYGRDKETADLLRLVRREVLTVLFGPSGTGKSSILKAGLFPQLRDDHHLPARPRLLHAADEIIEHTFPQGLV